ncbi:uncharacterized protein LOC143465175 [Clavelina lepadiformis]|uniref:uncharacterized protein LOC143465175 n=1 Tax=Clavelina lepadiformis TaxID=159417 RepID=UPI0040417C4E
MDKKRFICKVCNRTFNKKAHLSRHAVSHKKARYLVAMPSSRGRGRPRLKTRPASSVSPSSPNQPVPSTEHTCNICSKTFGNKFKLLRHSYSHMKVKPFQCDVCERRFSRKDHLKVHYRLHTGEKACYCYACGLGFNTTTSLHRHIVRFHSEDRKTIICPMCDMEFAFKAQLKKHFDAVHRSNLICPYCGNISHSDEGLYRHLKKHAITKPYVCIMCAANFVAANDMKYHECFPAAEDPCKVVVRVTLQEIESIEEIDPNDQKKASMLVRKFDNRGRKPKNPKPNDNQQDVSINDESSNVDWQCFTNGYSVQEPSDYPTGEGETCPVCWKMCGTTRDVAEHLSIHAENQMLIQNYFCKFCDISSPLQSEMEQHLQIEHPEGYYKCNFCATEFVHYSGKVRHQYNCHNNPDMKENRVEDTLIPTSHDDVQNYVPLSTNKKPQKFMARNYANGVADSTTYHCRQCDKTCGSMQEFLLHIQEHSVRIQGSAEVNCILCEEKFDCVEQLNRHIMNHEDNAIVEVGIHSSDEIKENDCSVLSSHI